ncbi:MAG: EF2563 family selenium-dependent molybdenum hydroxylase system protein [Treponema sp.]|jgi:xanthine dehydrogenase accessory factor|nr:EF2563 family selenium-dependent molybdenum hydroxylase system protein [Treponema sp.]
MFVVIRGAGDLASGVALRLHHAGFEIAMTEIAAPLSVRRTVSFSQAVYEGRMQVEDLLAVLVKDEAGMRGAFEKKQIAVFVDPSASVVKSFKPDVLVDAVMAKKNTGTAITDAPVVISIGPGFTASIDCHAVIETQRGHTLGRVITTGSAIPDTGVPGELGGYTVERLLRSPADGVFEAVASIGDLVKKGEIVAYANGIPINAEIDGILRGLLPSGVVVKRGMKAGDVDPRCEKSHCFIVSDKALAVGGGVLEAILRINNGIS